MKVVDNYKSWACFESKIEDFTDIRLVLINFLNEIYRYDIPLEMLRFSFSLELNDENMFWLIELDRELTDVGNLYMIMSEIIQKHRISVWDCSKLVVNFNLIENDGLSDAFYAKIEKKWFKFIQDSNDARNNIVED